MSSGRLALIPSPVETYSSSENVYTDLDIPRGVTGRLPKSQQTRAGLGAEVLEDLGETGKRGGGTRPARSDERPAARRDGGRGEGRGAARDGGRDGLADEKADGEGRGRRRGGRGRSGGEGAPRTDGGAERAERAPSTRESSGTPATGAPATDAPASGGDEAGAPRRRRRRRSRGGASGAPAAPTPSDA